MDNIDTVQAHLNNGTIQARKRTNIGDLLLAVQWLRAYEGDPSDDKLNMVSLATVARKLKREAFRRPITTKE